MENLSQNRLEDQVRKNRNVAIAVAIILLLSIIGNVVFMVRNSNLGERNEELMAEKESLIAEKDQISEEKAELRDSLNAMIQRYDELEQKSSDLEEEISAKDSRIVHLRREAESKEELQNELEEYKELKDKYEEVKREREKLSEEIREINQKLEELQSEYDLLVDKKQEAKKLNAYHIFVRHKQYRLICPDRYVERARRVDNTYINFEIDGSVFTEDGERNVHIVMLDPQDNVMYPGDETFEKKDDTQTEFTSMREVNYTGEPLLLDFTVEHPERLDDGNYTVEVYIDGRFVRSEGFTLE